MRAGTAYAGNARKSAVTAMYYHVGLRCKIAKHARSTFVLVANASVIVDSVFIYQFNPGPS